MKRYQSAFTLVELVMTIVILGILAAVAIPKFANLNDNAHTAVMAKIRTNFEVAVNLARSKSIVNKTATGYPDILMEGSCIQIDSTSGYPLIDQTTGTCVAVASLMPETDTLQSMALINPLNFSITIADIFMSTTVHAAPPPPPPPQSLTGELPSLLLGNDFTSWSWTRNSPTATMTSPEGLSFTYNQNTGEVN